MARRSKEDAEKTRARILASALALFVSKGYEHTTFTDIASRLKLTKGAVYWHFDSKATLLAALVKMAFDKFQRQIELLMPRGELTFQAVAEMMVENASRVVGDPKAAAFFRLMKCQIEWTDAKMSKVRENLLNDEHFGPKQAFKRAVANDIAAKRAREGVAADEISEVCLAVWDGLVQARLDHFLQCDLEKTLRDTYAAMWESIRLKD